MKFQKIDYNGFLLVIENHKFMFSHHLDVADLNELVDDGGGEAANQLEVSILDKPMSEVFLHVWKPLSWCNLMTLNSEAFVQMRKLKKNRAS